MVLPPTVQTMDMRHQVTGLPTRTTSVKSEINKGGMEIYPMKYLGNSTGSQ